MGCRWTTGSDDTSHRRQSCLHLQRLRQDHRRTR
nr:hypothetical protein [Pseudomonas fluorescens]